MENAINNFTLRESAVLEGLLAEKTYKQIGAEMGLAPKTIEMYASRCYKKYRVRGKRELYEKLKIRQFDRLGFIEERLRAIEREIAILEGKCASL